LAGRGKIGEFQEVLKSNGNERVKGTNGNELVKGYSQY